MLQNCRNFSGFRKPCRKVAGDFPLSGNRAAKLQETFRLPETLSQNCRRLSGFRKPCRKIAGDFPLSGNRAAKLQEHLRKVKHSIRKCKRLRDFFPLFLLSLFLFFIPLQSKNIKTRDYETDNRQTGARRPLDTGRILAEMASLQTEKASLYRFAKRICKNGVQGTNRARAGIHWSMVTIDLERVNVACCYQVNDGMRN